MDLSDCPYFRGEETCAYGCWEEPSCITDEPIDGWPSQRAKDGLPFALAPPGSTEQ